MSLVISSALVLAGAADGLSLDHPVIGWHNVVTSATIVATNEDANYPASNLANPATHLEWRANNDGVQYLTVTTNEVDPIDYLAVAGHNFFSEAIPTSVEGFIDGVWTEIVEEVMLPDDGPALYRFDLQSLSQVRLKMQVASDSHLPRAAVVYVGKLLVIERRVYVGHTPLPDGIKTSVANGRSETGKFLGRIVLGQWRESTVPLSLISPAWFRTYMRPFLRDGRDLPFFFGWRPQSYPREIGLGYLVDDPAPAPVGPSNLLAFDLKVSGIA
ncbi:hypothetical protein [Bradyrhizobium sp. Bra78]|uniref:hypothetical protein n=1 Tax=Bradyrhizobium sp. Bra78 TaxID=2926010 RepID=UPI0021C6DFEA|nr:hypothetical protein [Bradyrhizobium sp. Bra78]